jgi:hypothetical protein
MGAGTLKSKEPLRNTSSKQSPAARLSNHVGSLTTVVVGADVVVVVDEVLPVPPPQAARRSSDISVAVTLRMWGSLRGRARVPGG